MIFNKVYKKQCSKCGEDKFLTEFIHYKSGKNIRYYFSYCKSCMKLYSKKWRQKYPEQVKKHKKHSYQLHRDKSLNRSRRWKKEHLEQVKKYNERWRKENSRHTFNYRKKWGREHPYSIKVYNLRRRILTSDLTTETIQKVYEDNIKLYDTLTCYLCGLPIPFGKDHLEHKIPLSRGGSNEYENLGVAHFSCNCKKHTKTEEEFQESRRK